MKRERITKDAIDEALSRIEFPGEDEEFIQGYLEERGFVETVMRAVRETRIRMPRSMVWGAIGLLNVTIIIVAWTNPYLVQDVLALRNELFTFFFGFLGLTLLGCVAGVLLSSDLGRMEAFFKDLMRDRGKDSFRHR